MTVLVHNMLERGRNKKLLARNIQLRIHSSQQHAYLANREDLVLPKRD
jgi:hypothetical protein